MWNYYLVEEFIMNQKWIAENGNNWAAGRVECFDENEYCGYSSREYSLIIDRKDWCKFDDFLRNYSSPSLQSLDNLIEYSSLSIVRFKHESGV
jgi:hypothetical protein